MQVPIRLAAARPGVTGPCGGEAANWVVSHRLGARPRAIRSRPCGAFGSDSYRKKLKDFPEKERALWRIFDQTPFEDGVAAERMSSELVLKLLDYPFNKAMASRYIREASGRE